MAYLQAVLTDFRLGFVQLQNSFILKAGNQVTHDIFIADEGAL